MISPLRSTLVTFSCGVYDSPVTGEQFKPYLRMIWPITDLDFLEYVALPPEAPAAVIDCPVDSTKSRLNGFLARRGVSIRCQSDSACCNASKDRESLFD